MKAWKFQKSTGRGKNRRSARRAGPTDRNQWFKSGSALLWALMARTGLPFRSLNDAQP